MKTIVVWNIDSAHRGARAREVVNREGLEKSAITSKRRMEYIIEGANPDFLNLRGGSATCRPLLYIFWNEVCEDIPKLFLKFREVVSAVKERLAFYLVVSTVG